MRRLRRVCAAVGSEFCSNEPVILFIIIPLDRRTIFVSCSATIANPRKHMEDIFGLSSSEIEIVTDDGAPSGSKEFLMWNPALIDPQASAQRRQSSLSEAVILMEFLMQHGIRVILFCKVRSCSCFVLWS